ncbi:retrovirus-related pol polyprotein from transposon TNT 1-94 [Tanacetum coccineum]
MAASLPKKKKFKAASTASTTEKNEDKISLKLMVNTEENRVIFAEADSSFVDALFSFMTLPLGTIVRLVEKVPDEKIKPLGSLNNLYHSLGDFPDKYMSSEESKFRMLNPKSMSYDHCQKLKLNIDDTEPEKHFICENLDCFRRSGALYISCSSAKCHYCEKLMNLEIKFEGSTDRKGGDGKGSVFVSDEMTFVVTDDLKVFPNTLGLSVRMLCDFGTTDLRKLEQGSFDIGLEQAMESAFQSSLQGDKRPQPNFGRGSSSRGGRGGRNFGGRGRGQSYGRGREKICHQKNQQQEKILEGKQEDGNVFFCHSANVERSDTWFLDSGCSNHMTGDESILVDIDTAGNSQVKMGNGAFVQVKGKVKIPVKTKTEGNNRWNRRFPITFRYEEHTAFKATTADEALLWHRRLGHLNFQSLNLLHQKNMVGGLPQIHEIEGVCEGCALGKHHRKPFLKGVAWRAKEILELVNTDLCGPMRNPSHGNNLYFILFIDDFSRMTWVYFMKEKSQVFGIFKKFKIFVEKQTGSFIKILRSDQGKEYNSKEFDKFCKDEGMHRQLTTRYTPQQNGAVERKNQTVVEMAKSMMHEKGLPKSFWAEAVYSAIYLLNRSPTKSLDNKTPLEAWNGRKPSDEAHVESDENQPSHDEVPSEEPDEESQSPPPRKFRSLTEIYNANFYHVEPDCFKEAIREESWKKAMEDEIQYNANGSVQRNKARLVAKGYSQQPRIDYDETFALVARMDTVRAIISLAGQKGWLLYQIDVKSAFLNGELKEEVYVNQPQGFEVEGKEEKVYKLKKALYGLKQAPRAWYSQIDGYFKEKGFDQSKSEPTLYVKNQGTSDILIVALYVDDLVFTGNNKKMIEDFKNEMMQKYEMSDLGLPNHFLRMEIYQDDGGDTPLVVNEKLMKEDGSSKVDATLYRSLVGKLLYLTATRPDIMFAGGCTDDMRSTSGYIFSLGSGVFSWCSKKQQMVAQSSAEAEYVAAALATSQAIWLRRIFEDIGEK